MANNKSWSKDFHNVIKDTDRNLASIKVSYLKIARISKQFPTS